MKEERQDESLYQQGFRGLAQHDFHALSHEDAAKLLETDISQGLSDEEVVRRREIFGLNTLEGKKRKTVFSMFIEQFKSFMILVLLVAAAISAALGERADAIIIAAIVVLNAIMGVVQENKAENALEALKKMSAPHCKLLRNGKVSIHAVAEIVPGDIVVLDTGDYVPADLRLFETVNLQIEEAALTGESVPVSKEAAELISEEASLGDRYNMAFSSSLVTYGRGQGIVAFTGMHTQVGKIATMIQQVDATETPLKRRLENLGKVLGVAVLIICAAMFLVGKLYGKDTFEMFLTAVSLAVAAIPEGLPAIATIVLALGVQRMAQQNAIIRTLPAVETLGSATVICSDKTGTLTQNRMTVKRVYTLQGQEDPEKLAHMDDTMKLLLLGGLLCNDSRYGEDGAPIGDPTEIALLNVAEEAGLSQEAYEKAMPRVMELPFDSQRKLMTTVHKTDKHFQVFTKGAIDELLAICKGCRKGNEILPLNEALIEEIREQNRGMALGALRVLGLAYKELDQLPAQEESNSLEGELIFVGLFGMIDPPRPEAGEAVHICRHAGIKPVMITGDHKLTAMAIGRDLGIIEDESEALSGVELDKLSQEELTRNIEKYAVFARVSPEHKVRIVDAWQTRGQVVAMTGDGVNDAPALKRADIGAAMGITGTDVAKEAADMVLTDDNFATIVHAVKEGRRIFDNILRSVQFLLSCNVGEVLALFTATILNWSMPLLPIHLLWVNLVTDSLPAMALGVEKPEENVMDRPPVIRKSLFSPAMVWRILYQGIMIGALTLIAFTWGNRESLELGRTMAFSVLALSQLFHAFNLRFHSQSIFRGKGSRNPYLYGAFLISALLTVGVVEIPFIADIFHLISPDWIHWGQILLLSVTPIVVVELFKLLKINGGKS